MGDRRTSLNERGITLEAVIITAIAALMAAAVGVVVYNVIASESGDINDRAETIENVPPVFQEDPLTLELTPRAPRADSNPVDNRKMCTNGDVANECVPCSPNPDITRPTADDCPPNNQECDHGGMSGINDPCRDCSDFPAQTGVAQDNCPFRSRFTKIVSSGYHACGLSNSDLAPNGRLVPGSTEAPGSLIYCWGNNQDGQLNSDKSIGASSATLKTFPPASNENPINNIDEVSLGDTFSCIRRPVEERVVLTGIGIWCWGSNSGFQLGIDDTTLTEPIPVNKNNIRTRGHGISPRVTPTQLSLGQDVGCILGTATEELPPSQALTSQSALCWGEGAFTLNGPLSREIVRDSDGNPVRDARGRTMLKYPIQGDRHEPTDILQQYDPFNRNAKDNPADTTETTGIYRRGSFGGTHTILGVEYNLRFDKIKDISVGNQHACVVREPFNDPRTGLIPHDSVYCWGDNQYKQLGIETIQDRDALFLSSNSISDIAQLLPNSTSNLLVPGIQTIEKISAGNDFTCVIASTSAPTPVDNGVWCWGLNHYGQIGVAPADGIGNKGMTNHIRTATPVEIDGVAIKGALDIEVKGYRACIITAGRELACWGINEGFPPPRGNRDSRAILSKKFWTNARAEGRLHSPRSTPDGNQVLKPTLIPGDADGNPISDVQQIIVMEAQVCFLDADNIMKCFGNDAEGRLGPYEDPTIQDALGN